MKKSAKPFTEPKLGPAYLEKDPSLEEPTSHESGLPGAVEWEDIPGTAFTAKSGEQVRFRFGQFSFSPSTSAQGTTAVVQRQKQTTPVPVPVEPVLVGLTLSTGSIVAGTQTTGTVRRSAASSIGLLVSVNADRPGLGFSSPSVQIPAGAATGAFLITGTSAGTYTLTAKAGTKSFTETLTVTPKVAPGPPQLAFVSATPATVESGQSTMGTAALAGPAIAGPVDIRLTSDNAPVIVPDHVTVPLQGTGVDFEVKTQAGLTVAVSGVILAELLGETKMCSVHVMPRGVEKVLRLKDYGAVGDGATQCQAAMYRALAAAGKGGCGIEIGAGAFNMDGPIRFEGGPRIDITNLSGLSIYGQGMDATKLLFPPGAVDCFLYRPAGLKGNSIRDLTIQGGNRGVAVLNSQSEMRIQRVRFQDVGWGYAAVRGEGFDNGEGVWEILIEDCEVIGWQAIGLMIHGGETVRNCVLEQSVANQDFNYAHSFYIANAMAARTLVENIVIKRSSGHAWQVYADSQRPVGTEARNIIIRNVQCLSPHFGPIIAANGYHRDILIENVLVGPVRDRNSPTFVVSATNGIIERLTLRAIELQGGGDGLALQTGANVNIRNSQIERLVVKNHGTGVVVPGGWPYSNFANVQLLSPTFTNVGRPLPSPLPAGLTVTP